MSQLQKTYGRESAVIDLVQETRQFLDQISADIHQCGFPHARTFDPAGGTPVSGISAGMLAVSQNAMQFEADVDGSGSVSEVFLQEIVPVGGCPCRVQRGVISKAAFLAGGVPTYYTEVDNIMNQDIFTAYFFDGTTVALPAAVSDLPNVKTVKIKLSVQSGTLDANTRQFPFVSLTTSAKVSNN
jgi:hypothetical protein